MEQNVNIFKRSKSLIPSLLKVFSMFQMHILYDKKYEKENVLEAIYIKFNTLNKDNGLYLKDTTIEENITKFVFN